MAYTDQQVLQWFLDNPNATDAQIAQTAAAAQIPDEQLSRVTGVSVDEIQARVAATDTGTLSAPAAATDAPKSLAELTSNRYEDYLNANPDVKAEFEKFSAKNPEKWTPESYAAYHLTNYGLGEGRTGGDFQSSVDVLTKQILAQGTTSKWAGEGFGSAEKNAADMAKILAAHGITDISQFGEIKQTVQGYPIYGGPDDDPVLLGYGPDKVITTYGNKETGQALTNTYGERQTGNAWGGTYAGEGNTAYRVQFDAQGNPFFYTTGASSNDLAGLLENPILNIAANAAAAYFGGPLGAGALQIAKGGDLSDAAKAALLTYGGQQLSSSLSSTDLGMNSNLTMAQIESGLGTEGYGVGAQATQSGLFDPSVIGSGAYTQTSYPYDMSEFLAADAQNLYSQVGSNIPAIEQNLVASGVDPLVAADVANQIILNPNISTYDLTNYINTNFGGGSLYDVNTAAQYPTSTVTGTGGLLDGSAAPATTATATPTTSTNTSSLTPAQISNLIKAGVGLLGTGAVANAVGGGGGVGALPTQGVPTGNQDYYNAIQQYYNAYMPAAPRDVATPLQNWYNSKYGA